MHPYRKPAALKEETIPANNLAEKMRLLAKDNSLVEEQYQEKLLRRREKQCKKREDKTLRESAKAEKAAIKLTKKVIKKINRTAKQGRRELGYTVLFWSEDKWRRTVGKRIQKLLEANNSGFQVRGSKHLTINW